MRDQYNPRDRCVEDRPPTSTPDLTPAHLEFAAKLCGFIEKNRALQSSWEPFVERYVREDPWFTFGRVVEACRERGCKVELIVTAKRCSVNVFHRRNWHRREHRSPAVAAIRAAYDALGGEA